MDETNCIHMYIRLPKLNEIAFALILTIQGLQQNLLAEAIECTEIGWVSCSFKNVLE